MSLLELDNIEFLPDSTPVDPTVQSFEGDQFFQQQRQQGAPILIVDDKEENLYAFRAVLENDGFKTVEARSGVEALRYLMEHEVSLILIDVQMPEMDGFETVQAIRAKDRHKDVPILFITAVHRSDDFADQGFSVGAHDYLTKPIDNRLLVNKVNLFHTLYVQQQELKRSHEALLISERKRRKAEAREQYAAYQAGLSEMTMQVLHNIGNAVQGVETAFLEVNAMRGEVLKIEQLFKEPLEQLELARQQQNSERTEEITNNLVTALEQLPKILVEGICERIDQTSSTAGSGIRHIIDILKTYHRSENRIDYKGRPHRLVELIDDLKLLFDERVGQCGIELQEIVPQKNMEIQFSRNQLLHALGTLLLNSIEAIEDRSSEDDGHSGRIWIRAAVTQQSLVIEIEDNGNGFDVGDHRKLFSFGYTTRRGQSGIGLHMVGNFVSAMKGEIGIESGGHGQGCKVTLNLPMEKSALH